MIRWEHAVQPLGSRSPSDTQDTLDAMGEVGWELVAIDSGRAYFKREIIHASKTGPVPERVVKLLERIAAAAEHPNV